MSTAWLRLFMPTMLVDGMRMRNTRWETCWHKTGSYHPRLLLQLGVKVPCTLGAGPTRPAVPLIEACNGLVGESNDLVYSFCHCLRS